MQLRDLDILYIVKTDGSVDAAERLHLRLLPTPSVTVTPPPPGSLVLHFRPQNGLPTHSDVTICACTPRFISRMAMLSLGKTVKEFRFLCITKLDYKKVDAYLIQPYRQKQT